MYRIGSCGPPACRMGKELTAPHHKKVTYYRRQAVANMIIHSIYKVDNSLNTSKLYFVQQSATFRPRLGHPKVQKQF